MDEVMAGSAPRQEGSGPLAAEKALLASAKKLGLFCSGAASQKYPTNLAGSAGDHGGDCGHSHRNSGDGIRDSARGEICGPQRRRGAAWRNSAAARSFGVIQDPQSGFSEPSPRATCCARRWRFSAGLQSMIRSILSRLVARSLKRWSPRSATRCKRESQGACSSRPSPAPAIPASRAAR